MEEIRGKVSKGGKDAKGRIRKYVEIPELHSDDFESGEKVAITKLPKQGS